MKRHVARVPGVLQGLTRCIGAAVGGAQSDSILRIISLLGEIGFAVYVVRLQPLVAAANLAPFISPAHAD